MAKRLLIITNGLEMGGAEVQLTELAIRLHRERGWTVAVVSLIGPGTLSKQLAAVGIEEFSLDMKGILSRPLGFFRLMRIVNLWEPTIVHSHMIQANLLSRVVRPFCKLPVLVCTAHSVFEHKRLGGWSSALLDALYRWTDRLSDRTTTICQAAERRYLAEKLIHPSRSQVVYNGVDCGHFGPNSEVRDLVRKQLGIEGFAWLAVGRFDTPKDWPNLLNAFARLLKAGGTQEKQTLLIVGYGALQERLESLVQSLAIESWVRFLGLREDVQRLMMAADAYVMSSRWEGFPIVLLEAAASALPIVATDVGGNSEVVERDVTGLLVPAADSEALATAMQQMAEMEPVARQKMGQLGRVRVETHLNFSKILDQWEELYGRLLREKSAR